MIDVATPAGLAAIADEVLTTIGSGRQFPSFGERPTGLTVDDAYRVTALLERRRAERGEKIVGRKIGFTNGAMRQQYRVQEPIWGYIFDTTLHDLGRTSSFPLRGLPEPRIEPEIVFGLARAPEPEMDDVALLACVDWVAHGFEIVQSMFPGWRFSAADIVAACGAHGGLLVGPRHCIGTCATEWRKTLCSFRVNLLCNGRVVDEGGGANVLDGPVSAVRELVAVLARDPVNPPLAAGEIVTTGTLTRALPASSGETWSTTLEGIALEGVRVTLG